MENKLISGVLNCIYAIQFTVESYAAAINEIKKYQQDESKAITTTSETQAREINDQCELERLQLQSEGEAIVTEAATYHSSAVAHEREFSLLDKHYNKKKQRLEVDSSYVYSFENVQDPEEELRLIAEKIEKTGIGLLQKKSVFDSFSRKRTRQYAEIKYLLCRATEINENVQNKIPESLQMHFDEIHSHISDARQEIVESLSVKQKQLSTDINSMLEKADDNLIKNLQELVPSEALYSLADEIARHEHDLVNNQALGHVDPTVMVGSVRIRIPNKESAPLVSNLLNHLYGDLILYDQLVMPLGLSLNDTCSLLITLNKETEEKIYRGIQSIIAQMLARVPPTKLNCLFVDPKNAGKFFSPFMKLSAKDEKIAGKQVFTSQESINNCLDELYKHIDHVIQFKLSSGTGFNDIYSYNAQAGDNAESYKLLAVLDYPKNFSSDMMDKLVYIMEWGVSA